MEIQALPTLRPLRLGELLDRAIRLYRGNFLAFIGIIAVVYVPVIVLQTVANVLLSDSMYGNFSASQSPFTNLNYQIGVLLAALVALVQFVLVQGIATGALTRAVADIYLGKKTGILDAYRGIGGSWLTLLGALLLIGFVLIGIAIWSIVPCIGWFTGLGMLFFLMTAINPLVAPVVVLEKSGPWSSAQDNLFGRLGNLIVRSMLAIYRSWSLARRRFWPVLGYILVLYLFSLIIVYGPTLIVNVLLLQMSESFGDVATQMIVSSVIQGLVSLVFLLIYYPLQMTAYTLIYFDLRVRTEGFDLAIQTMESAGATDRSAAMLVPEIQVKEKLITASELGNFAILTLAGAGIYIFFMTFLVSLFFFASSMP